MTKDIGDIRPSDVSFDPLRASLAVRSAPFSPAIVAGLMVLADALAVLAAGHLVYALYVGWSPATYPQYLTAMTIHTMLLAAVFRAGNLYDLESISHLAYRVRKIVVLFGLAFLAVVGLAFAFKVSSQFSRVWAFGGAACGLASVFAMRVALRQTLGALGRAGRLTRNLAIVGTGPQAHALLDQLDSSAEPWIRILGLFDARRRARKPDARPRAVAGTLDDLIALARSHRVDDVILALPWSADRRLADIAAQLSELPVNLRLSSDLALLRYPLRLEAGAGGVPMLEIALRPLAGWKRVVKEAEDRLLAPLLIVLFAPVMLMIALAIKIEGPGPLLFTQRRYGFNNQVIRVAKFRTMRHDRPAEPHVPPATPGDARVGPVGWLLRRTGLDELPQLFNVLGGSMSLIGPRPLAVEHNQQHAAQISGYFARHRVKPGITGWAQVNGYRTNAHTPELMQARLEHDLYYIDNWSPLLDLQILVMTLFAMATGRNAY